MHANDVDNNFRRGDKIFQRGSIYFKHFCSGGSKYFDIFGPGGTKIGGSNFFITDLLIALIVLMDNVGSPSIWHVSMHIQFVWLAGVVPVSEFEAPVGPCMKKSLE